MSKKLILLLVISFLLFAFVLAIHKYATTIIPSNLKVRQKISNKSTPTPLNENALSFLPNQLIAPPGQQASLDIVISSLGTPPNLVQLEIAYDPMLLTNIAITPGDFFTNPIILLQTINENTGRISYAIEKSSDQNWMKTEGVVARLSFTPRPGVFQKETSFSFLPKTLVRTNGEKNNIKAATGATILIQATSSALMR